ncbi:MAG: hypothetical protein V7K41_09990 [Nostoc sp.]|uniref:hypothetical protein n=1 Tax=Nostoc sp. TaxID=1180 RepID=UPI002FF589C3
MLLLTVGTGSISKNKFTSRLSTSVACVLLLLTTGCSQVQTKSAQSIHPLELYTSLNQDFFKGTGVEKAANEYLSLVISH